MMDLHIMMRFFAQDLNKSRIEYKFRKTHHDVPIGDLEEIRNMYEQSLYHSYWDLWVSNPAAFAKDILLRHDILEHAIRIYAKEIADLTIKEWEENNLISVIAYQGGGCNRKIVGFALAGEDREANAEKDVCAYYFYYLGTDPASLKQGIATQLVSQLLCHCHDAARQRANQTLSMKLHTRVFNAPAIHLYEKFGFQVVSDDVTHGHSAKYVCYQNRYRPDQTIECQPKFKLVA